MLLRVGEGTREHCGVRREKATAGPCVLAAKAEPGSGRFKPLGDSGDPHSNGKTVTRATEEATQGRTMPVWPRERAAAVQGCVYAKMLGSRGVSDASTRVSAPTDVS